MLFLFKHLDNIFENSPNTEGRVIKYLNGKIKDFCSMVMYDHDLLLLPENLYRMSSRFHYFNLEVNICGSSLDIERRVYH